MFLMDFISPKKFGTKGFKLMNNFLEMIHDDCCNCSVQRFCLSRTCFKSAMGKSSLSKKVFRNNCRLKRAHIIDTFKIYMHYEEKYPEIFREMAENPNKY